MNTPEHLTPEKIEQGRKLLQRLKDYSCYERVRTQWHGDGNHNLAVDIQSVIAAAELGMASRLDREVLHAAIVNAIIGRGKFRGWASDVADDVLNLLPPDQLTGRIE